jgi:hypothetical protein
MRPTGVHRELCERVRSAANDDDAVVRAVQALGLGRGGQVGGGQVAQSARTMSIVSSVLRERGYPPGLSPPRETRRPAR